MFHANGTKGKRGWLNFTPDTTSFKTKTVTRDKGHYRMIKASVIEDIMFANTYARPTEQHLNL